MDELIDECQKKAHELDVYLEKYKCRLALKVDFNLRDLFRFLDLGSKGYIDAYDLKRVSDYLGIRLGQDQPGMLEDLIKNFISTYDKDHD